MRRRTGYEDLSTDSAKRLEELLGHRLFDRTTRGVKLTLAGQLLAERARSTIEKVHDDLAQVRRLGRGEEGTLTVGFSGSVMFTKLPAAIESYRRLYPKVELRLRELVTSAQIAALLNTGAKPDKQLLAFIRARPGESEDRNCFHWRYRQIAARFRGCRAGYRGSDGLARNTRWARENAPSESARRNLISAARGRYCGSCDSALASAKYSAAGQNGTVT